MCMPALVCTVYLSIILADKISYCVICENIQENFYKIANLGSCSF